MPSDDQGSGASVIEILEVGAAPIDAPPPWLSLVQAGEARLTLVEPNVTQAEKLREMYPAPHRVIEAATGEPGQRNLYICRWPGCTSLYEPDPAVINRYEGIGTEGGEANGNFWVQAIKPVTVKPILEILGDVWPQFVRLDIQGAELEVLQEMGERLLRVLVIECEVEFSALYKDQPLFGNIASWLRSQGFALWDLRNIGRRRLRGQNSGDGQLLWADAIFVRSWNSARWTKEEAQIAGKLLDMYPASVAKAA